MVGFTDDDDDDDSGRATGKDIPPVDGFTDDDDDAGRATGKDIPLTPSELGNTGGRGLRRVIGLGGLGIAT